MRCLLILYLLFYVASILPFLQNPFREPFIHSVTYSNSGFFTRIALTASDGEKEEKKKKDVDARSFFESEILWKHTQAFIHSCHQHKHTHHRLLTFRLRGLMARIISHELAGRHQHIRGHFPFSFLRSFDTLYLFKELMTAVFFEARDFPWIFPEKSSLIVDQIDGRGGGWRDV